MERIISARKKAGLTQEQLAATIGVKRAVISKYETGAIEPSISQLQKISDALNVSISYLLGANDDPDKSSFNSVAFDLAIREHIIQEKELIEDSKSNLALRLSAIEKAKASHISSVMEICTDTQKLDAAQQAHEIELLPERIAIVTDFIEKNAAYLREQMPGMTPQKSDSKK